MSRVWCNPNLFHYTQLISAGIVVYIWLFSSHIFTRPLSRQQTRLRGLPGKTPSNQTALAGVYSPFVFSPGGGEKVTLHAIKVLQTLGYRVILFLGNDECSTMSCIQHTAEVLTVRGIRFEDLVVVAIDPHKRKKRKLDTGADLHVFWSIGNTKIPFTFGIGRQLNMYTCQFPFDMEKSVTSEDLSVLASYQLILAYSKFTETWISRSLSSSFESLASLRRSSPYIQVLYPPAIEHGMPADEIASYSALKFRDNEVHIAMLGRFFLGRQSKGHQFGIVALKSLLSQTTASLHLHLVGAIQPGFENYVEQLQRDAMGLPVTFHIAAPSSEVISILRRSLLYWHMTGVDQPRDATADPASMEHFGISIVEAMRYGCIPIVLNQGGPVEIVEHSNTGYTAATVDEFVQYSLEIIAQFPNSSASDKSSRAVLRRKNINLTAMQLNAIRSSTKFLVSNFESSFIRIVLNGTTGRTSRS